MVLGGETADQWEKRNRGLMEPEVTWFGRGNRCPVAKKGSWAQGSQTAEKMGVTLANNTKNEINHVYCYTLFLQ